MAKVRRKGKRAREKGRDKGKSSWGEGKTGDLARRDEILGWEDAREDSWGGESVFGERKLGCGW